MLIKHELLNLLNDRLPKINRFDMYISTCISNLALSLTHSLAFKRYTRSYALLYTVIFMMMSMYMFQFLNNMYHKLVNVSWRWRWFFGLKSKMLNIYFWNNSEKMFQTDLNSDLKEEPDLKSRPWFTLFGPAMQGSWYASIYWNIPECGQVFIHKCNQE